MRRALVVGCGYVGKLVAQLFHGAGWQVTGVTRSDESAHALAGEPWRALACDCSDRGAVEKLLAEFREADAVVQCASAGGGGVEAYRQAYFAVAKNLSEILAPKRLLFTSSTSVYPQTDGSVVTEESLAEPERETGQILRETEKVVLAAGGTVARLAGIYGPGRSASLQKFLDGRAVIEGDGARHLNFIHREDAASALLFLVCENAPPGIYNLTDGAPISQREFYRELAETFHRPLPPHGPVEMDRKRGWTDKQVANAKLCALGWRPHFPSFRDACAQDAI